MEKTSEAKHGLHLEHYPGEEEGYKCEDYSLFTEWEAALLKGGPLWAVHAAFYTFLN